MTDLVRPPAVAGLFYPDDPAELAAWVDGAIERAGRWIPPGEAAPRAVIAPHAGYRFSGGVAAAAWSRVARARAGVRRVLLLGPTHRVPVRGLAVPSVDALDTPLGAVALDGEGRAEILDLGQVVVADEPHAAEHSLEVHLPFLQRTLPGVPVLPLAVGRASADEVAEVIDRCWDAGTIVVASTDLSHYHPLAEARELDASTIEAILALDAESLAPERACGALPVQGLLVAARRRGAAIAALDVLTSGDTEGPADRVVGYAAFALWDPPGPDDALGPDDAAALAELAVASVRAGVATGRPPHVDLAAVPPRLRVPAAAFVTLERGDRLRGCIGTLTSRAPLAVEVAGRAVDAARNDPRFPPVTADELDELSVKVSVLSPPRPFPCAGYDELVAAVEPSVDGLVVADGPRRATFLPSVWTQLAEPAEFVARLWAKAGLPPRHWSSETVVSRYRSQEL